MAVYVNAAVKETGIPPVTVAAIELSDNALFMNNIAPEAFIVAFTATTYLLPAVKEIASEPDWTNVMLA